MSDVESGMSPDEQLEKQKQWLVEWFLEQIAVHDKALAAFMNRRE